MATIISERVVSRAAALLLAKSFTVPPIAEREDQARQVVKTARREHGHCGMLTGSSVKLPMTGSRYMLRGAH